MANRIIKESAFSSDKISGLNDFEFRLWVGLITQADDCGRGDARAAIIKGRVFPLRERVTIKDIETAIHGLAGKGCISLYNVGGKSYFYFPTWSNHQRVRDAKPKYPDPIIIDNGEPPQLAANRGLNPIQSNPNPNPNPNPSESAHTRFTPPTVAEVTAYCAERGNGLDAQQFTDFYASKGWKVGREPMRDWKAAVRTWERREKELKGGERWDFRDI